LTSFLEAARSAVPPAVWADVYKYESATVTSQQAGLLPYQESPSGRLPSRLFIPTGSLEMGIPAEVKVHAIKSLTAWCKQQCAAVIFIIVLI